MNKEMTLVSDFVVTNLRSNFISLSIPYGATFYSFNGKFVYKDAYYSEEAQIQNDLFF